MEGTPPVRTSPPRLLRVLLIVLSHLGTSVRHVRGAGLNLMVRREDEGVVFRFSVHGGDTTAAPQSLVEVAEPLSALLAMDGGALSLTPAGVSFSLPPLSRAGL